MCSALKKRSLLSPVNEMSRPEVVVVEKLGSSEWLCSRFSPVSLFLLVLLSSLPLPDWLLGFSLLEDCACDCDKREQKEIYNVSVWQEGRREQCESTVQEEEKEQTESAASCLLLSFSCCWTESLLLLLQLFWWRISPCSRFSLTVCASDLRSDHWDPLFRHPVAICGSFSCRIFD